MKQKGFTLIELLIVIAILGIIAAVIIPNIENFIKTGRARANETAIEELASRPINSLNLTELEFMVDYYLMANSQNPCLAAVYQNQIIINELTE